MITIGHIVAFAIGAIIAGWYGRRWGFDDGHAEGYDKGRQKGLLEANGIANGGVTPSLAGGPREPA